ncbi:MAG: DUF167 family protein [Rhodospirillales bacterium]
MPFAVVPEGLQVRVFLTPKAARARIDGLVTDADGTMHLKMSVTAAPEKGKANAAMLKLLAKAWRLPKSSLAVIAGAKERRKTVLAAGDGAALSARLCAWLAGLDKQDKQERNHD